MLITTRQNFENMRILEEVKVVTSTSSYGIVFLTGLVLSFCQLFGCRCKMLEKKLEMAKKQALSIVIEKAESYHANAIVDLKINNNLLNVFVTGLSVIVDYSNQTNIQ